MSSGDRSLSYEGGASLNFPVGQSGKLTGSIVRSYRAFEHINSHQRPAPAAEPEQRSTDPGRHAPVLVGPPMNATIRRSVIVVLALGLAGCDLFKPETLEPPGGNVLPPVVELDYSSAEQTLTTIAAAIKAKDLGNGHRAFILAFADAELDSVPAYTASFDTADVNDFLLSTGRDSIET